MKNKLCMYIPWCSSMMKGKQWGVTAACHCHANSSLTQMLKKKCYIYKKRHVPSYQNFLLGLWKFKYITWQSYSLLCSCITCRNIKTSSFHWKNVSKWNSILIHIKNYESIFIIQHLNINETLVLCSQTNERSWKSHDAASIISVTIRTAHRTAEWKYDGKNYEQCIVLNFEVTR